MAKELSDEAKAVRREYKRKWSAANRERCKEYQRRHWEKRAAQLKNDMEDKETNDEH